jgi:hypothetical protein
MWQMAKFIKTTEQFREAVSEGLTGAPVLAVTSEPGLGSLFHLGTWIPRQSAIENPTLSDRLRSFEGSKSLNIHCLWELSSPFDLVAPGTSLIGQTARMRLLEVLEGQTIASVFFGKDDLVMTLEVQSGVSLKVLVRSRGFGPGGYTVGLKDGFWTAHFDGTATLWTPPE